MPLKPIKTKCRLEKIKDNPERVFWYAFNILEKRWPEVEPVIIKSPRNAYCYALHVIKGRWPEAEPFIEKNKNAWSYYKQHLNI